MRDQQVPDHGLEGLGMRRHVVRIDRRYDDDHVADLRRVASVTADHPEDARADFLRELQRTNQIGADILLDIAAADREDEDRAVRIEPADCEPLAEDDVPASPLVRAVSSETLSVGA